MLSENEEEQQYEEEEEQPRQGRRTMQRAPQNRRMPPLNEGQQQQMVSRESGRRAAIRESRIKDRPVPKETRESSLKIKIELDLEVEVSKNPRIAPCLYSSSGCNRSIPYRWTCTLECKETLLLGSCRGYTFGNLTLLYQ